MKSFIAVGIFTFTMHAQAGPLARPDALANSLGARMATDGGEELLASLFALASIAAFATRSLRKKRDETGEWR